MNIMNSYTPKDGKYKCSSCREFIEDSGKITVLSINQDSLPALYSIVYTLLQSLFEHQVINIKCPAHQKLPAFNKTRDAHTAHENTFPCKALPQQWQKGSKGQKHDHISKKIDHRVDIPDFHRVEWDQVHIAQRKKCSAVT